MIHVLFCAQFQKLDSVKANRLKGLSFSERHQNDATFVVANEKWHHSGIKKRHHSGSVPASGVKNDAE